MSFRSCYLSGCFSEKSSEQHKKVQNRLFYTVMEQREVVCTVCILLVNPVYTPCGVLDPCAKVTTEKQRRKRPDTVRSVELLRVWYGGEKGREEMDWTLLLRQGVTRPTYTDMRRTHTFRDTRTSVLCEDMLMESPSQTARQADGATQESALPRIPQCNAPNPEEWTPWDPTDMLLFLLKHSLAVGVASFSHSVFLHKQGDSRVRKQQCLHLSQPQRILFPDV